jgi:hypothetical protein
VGVPAFCELLFTFPPLERTVPFNVKRCESTSCQETPLQTEFHFPNGDRRVAVRWPKRLLAESASQIVIVYC